MFVPTAIVANGWCGPYRRLRNPDIAMTRCVLMEGGVLTYVNYRMQGLWEIQGLDWKALAIRNLAERTKSGEGILVNRPGGDLRMVRFQQADRLGTSRLPLRGTIAKWFPSGYRVALPDRACGMAFAMDLSAEETQNVRQMIDMWYQKGPRQFVSGMYSPDDLLSDPSAKETELVPERLPRLKSMSTLA